jgi:CubicO group peptidase (beta-lactamase class C family)
MSRRILISLATALALAVAGTGGCTSIGVSPAQGESASSSEMAALLEYLRVHDTTGIIVISNGEVLVDEAWPAPSDQPIFANFLYGHTEDGVLLEDVASQQKSFIAVLVAIAIDRGLLDADRPVSHYLGEGWSRASPLQEAQIRVVDVLTMSSGLNEQLEYVAPPGTTFFYNTPVYAITQRIVETAAAAPLEEITHDWLTAPTGMADTAWRRRPAALRAVGNDRALVTTPHDIARFGLMILHRGMSPDGVRIVSAEQLDALFIPSTANPAYGRLWWLNGGIYSVRVSGRRDGPLIPAAPIDLVGAFGAFDRRLYVVPSRGLVVVRTGSATNDSDFDQEFWLRLTAALD